MQTLDRAGRADEASEPGERAGSLHPCVAALLVDPGARERLQRYRVHDPRSGREYAAVCQERGWSLRPFERCLADPRACPVHSRFAWALPRTHPRGVWVSRPERLPEVLRRLPPSTQAPGKIVGVAPTPAFQRWCRRRGGLTLGGLFVIQGGAAPMVFSEAYEHGIEHHAAAAGFRTYCLALAAAYVDKGVTLGVGLVLAFLFTGRWPESVGEAMALLASLVAVMIGSAFLYYWAAVTLFGATVGQALVGLRVVNERGELPGPRRAFVRELAAMTPRYIPGVGHFVRIADYSWLLFSGGTQLLRDCAAGTRLAVRRNRISERVERLAAGFLAWLSRRRAPG